MEKKSKKSIIIGVTSLFLVTLILVGLTYAYYRTRIIGNESTDPSISVVSKKLEIVYSDGTATLNGNTFNGETNALVPGDVITKSFTVTNTGDEAITYNVVLENVVNTFTRPDLKLTLSCKNEDNTDCNGITAEDNQIYPAESTELVTNTISNVDNNNVQTYTLRIEYVNLEDVNQSEDMGKTFNGKLNITNKNTKTVVGTLANAQDGDYVIVESTPQRSEIINGKFKVIGLESGNHKITLYDKNDNKLAESTFEVGDTPKKISADRNAETISFEITDVRTMDIASSETLLFAIGRDNSTISSSEDDYGLSYYYSGDEVENNYINYAGMCWRIVRVLGNGTIKLALQDEHTTCDSATYTGDFEIGEPFGNETTCSSTHNYFADNDMFSVATTWMNGGSEYFYDDFDGNVGCMGNFESHIAIEEQTKLADAEWCQDTSIYQTELVYEDGNTFKEYEATTNGQLRTIGTNLAPTLKCDMKGIENSFATKITSKIGSLTADEVVFANGYLKGSYLTITPAMIEYSFTFDRYSPSNLRVSGDKIVHSCATDYCNFPYDIIDYIRPAVVLKSNVLLDATITGQNGTKTNPYVIG